MHLFKVQLCTYSYFKGERCILMIQKDVDLMVATRKSTVWYLLRKCIISD